MLPRCSVRHHGEVQPRHLEHLPAALSPRGPGQAAKAVPAGAGAAEKLTVTPDNLRRVL